MKTKVLATVVNKWGFKDVEKDFTDVINAIEKNKKSDIIVFPEICLSNFKDKKNYPQKIKKLKGLSKKNKIIICIGIEEITKKGIYDSAFLIDKDQINRYRKAHLVWDEPKYYNKGNLKFPVYETSIGKIGMLICYDNEFPESMRCLKLNGAEIICMPARWPIKISEYWDMLLRTRARENQVFLLASNDFNQRCGKSKIIDPLGNILTEVKQNEKPFSCTTTILKSSKIKKAKIFVGPNTDWIKNRRPNFYKKICKK